MAVLTTCLWQYRNTPRDSVLGCSSPLPTQGNPPEDADTFKHDAVYDMLEFYKQLQAYMPQGWLSHGYVETLNNWATEKAACLRAWGRTIGHIRQYAQKDRQNPDIFAATTMPKDAAAKAEAKTVQLLKELDTNKG
jgi:hypothetical protein